MDKLLKADKLLWRPLPGPQSDAYHSRADELFYGGSAGGGKALTCGIMIPTPKGYKRICDLQNGDEVFGMNGEACKVLSTSDVMTGHRVFDVVFDDGTVIRADGDHQWHTFTDAEREALLHRSDSYRENRRKNRPSRGIGKRPDLAIRNSKQVIGYTPEPVLGGMRTTLEIKNTLYANDKGRSNHAVPVAAPLVLPEKDLPLDPYVLGFWLGDGTSANGGVTVGNLYAEDTIRILTDCGYRVTKSNAVKYYYTIRGIVGLLRKIGVLKNKHIPEDYLFASIEQRKALLCGLMDTDGTAAKDGQCEFYGSNKRLVDDVSRLLHTLGIKHAIRTKKPPKDSKYNESYRIKFVASFPAFRLQAKAVRQNLSLRETQKYRYIVDVKEVETEPVKCIAVDSPDHLYLAGDGCIPTHNSALILGLSLTAHQKSIIFRREYPQLKELMDYSREVVRNRGKFNGQTSSWRLADKRSVEFAACQYESDVNKFQGRPHDLIAFDELPNFTEFQYRFLIGWNRTTKVGQRTRVVGAGNPPTNADGEWVIRRWAPWLDNQHANPAKPGELRWFAVLDGEDKELEDGTPFTYKGEEIKPKSRTFIPARLTDNPYLMATDYAATLQAMPEPLRTQLLYGDFHVSLDDNPWQIIPTKWIELAQARWKKDGRPNVSLSSLGVDVARGGKDKTVIAPRYANWFDELRKYTGAQTPDGKSAAGYVAQEWTVGAGINLDIIGVGTGAYDTLIEWKIPVNGVNNAAASTATDKTRKFKFVNLRAEAYWKLREALDPVTGDNIALPPDNELKADLCAPRWKLTVRGIQVESKEEIIDRLKRSPDCGDAVVLASMLGPVIMPFAQGAAARRQN